MKMRLTNVKCQTTRLTPLPGSTGEVLSVLEKDHRIDLTGFVVLCLDVWYGKTSNTLWLTRCGVDVTTFRIKDWSKNLGVICDGVDAETTLTTTIREWDAKARQDTEVEFIDVGISDINDMINWLRNEKNVFYTLPTQPCTDKTFDEQQKKIDSYESTLSKITDIMKPKYAGPTWSETLDDLVERIKRMKEKVETLEAENADWMNSFTKAQDSRSAFCKKLKEALNVDYRYPGSFPKMEEDILWEIKRLREANESVEYQISQRLRDIRQAAGMADDDSRDLVKYVGWLKDERIGWLDNYFEMKQSRDDERDKYGKLLADIRQAAGMADDDHGDLVEYVKALRESKEQYEQLYKGYEKAYHGLRDDQDRNKYGWLYMDLKDEILKVYREIFDCSNGDPEGSDEEVTQDILTEYKRVLKLKDAAEEALTTVKESLAREREWTKLMGQKLIEIQDICER